MKFAVIAKPRVFMDWNHEGSLELGALPGNEISVKAVTEFSCGMLSFSADESIRFAEGCKALGQKKTQASTKLTGEGGCFIQAQYTNSGDPYREGVRITIGVEDQWNDQITVDLDSYEAISFAGVMAEQASAMADTLSPEQPAADLVAKNAVLRDKAKCLGSLEVDLPADLEAHILKQTL